MTPESLSRVSQLLSSVPQSVSEAHWFADICAQLLPLLDDPDEDLQRVAAFAINQGILNRKSSGTPGTAGWNHLVQPLFENIRPNIVQEELNLERQIVDSLKLRQALGRFSKILLSHPNPGLFKRLVTPLLLPLWGILCASQSKSEEFERSSILLQRYCRVSAGSAGLIKVVKSLCWDGELEWLYCLDSSKHVQVLARLEHQRETNDMVLLLETIPRRVRLFVRLVEDSANEAEGIEVLLHVLEGCLNKESRQANSLGSQHDAHLQSYIFAQVAQELTAIQSSNISSNPSRIIEFIQTILSHYVKEDTNKAAQNQSKTLSLDSLGSIAGDSRASKINRDEEESSEALSISLSLLAVLLQDPVQKLSSETSSAVEKLRPALTRLCRSKQLPRSLIVSAQNLLSQFPSPTEPGKSSPVLPNGSPDIELHCKALESIADPQAPIRAHGVSQLEALIEANSVVISTPATTVTLLSILQDNESFVYLSALRALTSLARMDSMLVINQLIEAYQDNINKSSLDVRLRVGEALQSIIEEQAQEMPLFVFDKLVGLLLQTASGHPSQLSAFRAPVRERGPNQIKEEDADISLMADTAEISGSDTDTEVLQTRAKMAAILKGWRGRPGEEDVRIRASSLSILSTLIAYCSIHLVSGTVSRTVEVVNDILTRETGADKAILRRSAVLVFLSILKSSQSSNMLDIAGAGVEEHNISDESVAILQRLRIQDDDEIVRGHAESALESLTTLQEHRVQKLVAGENIILSLEERGGTLRGIDVDVPNEPGTTPRKPKIEELD